MLKNSEKYKGNLKAATNGNPDVDNYLKDYGVDVERYLPVGAKVLISDDKPDSVKIICVDNEKSTNDYDYFVTVRLDKVEDPLKVMEMFKSVDATIIHSSYDLEDVVIHKNYTLEEDKVGNRHKMEE